MYVKDFYYELPQRLIAQDPLEDRAGSHLMVLERLTGEVYHKRFRDIIEYLELGDCLVLNNTKVIPARLFGVRDSGGKVEVLLLKRTSIAETSSRERSRASNLSNSRFKCGKWRNGETCVWEALVRPGKKCRPGTRLSFGDGRLTGEVIEIVEDGNRLIRFFYEGIFEEVLDQLGQMPLPPYITHELKDKNRYQTVYARYDGSAAAPTAGLHFTEALLEEVRAKGVEIAEVTLHVGLGTFRPVKAENVLEHHMHSEYYRISKEAAERINRAKDSGHRVISVGTTSTRTLEAASDERGRLRECSGWTDIFIYPGYRFKVIDGLITNFHLPESTLIMLVSAFAGREKVLAAYREAVEREYRFFSFGDAMLIK